MNGQVSGEARNTGIIAYLTILGALIAISMNSGPRHPFARFHARQAFGLHVTFILGALVVSLVFDLFTGLTPFLFYSVWMGLYLFYFVLWLYGFLAAVQGKKREVPLLGRSFQVWFPFIP